MGDAFIDPSIYNLRCLFSAIVPAAIRLFYGFVGFPGFIAVSTGNLLIAVSRKQQLN
jgi:hypothetical protein